MTIMGRRCGPGFDQLADGKAVALVSDAGTPLISDPGYKLVAACRERDIMVLAVPGPSAVLAALAIPGLPTDRFMFAGFLAGSPTSTPRPDQRDRKELRATTIWFETPSRIAASLADMAGDLGPREAVVARELDQAARRSEMRHAWRTRRRDKSKQAEGEIVLVVGGKPRGDEEIDDAALDGMLRAELDGQRLRDAVKVVVEATGLPRNRVYRAALRRWTVMRQTPADRRQAERTGRARRTCRALPGLSARVTGFWPGVTGRLAARSTLWCGVAA